MQNQFSQRLSSVMASESTSKRLLSTKTEIDRKSIIWYTTGKRYPRYDSLIKIADYFEVSVDYLTGLSDDEFAVCISEYSLDKVREFFVSRVKGILADKGYSEYRLAKLINIGQSTVSKWLHGNSMPDVPIMVEIAKTLDCSLDYLLGRTIKQD